MKEYKVSYRTSNKAQIKGEEPGDDIRDDIFIDGAENEHDAILLAMDHIIENLGWMYSSECKDDEIIVYDDEGEPFEMYDWFEAKAIGED